MKLIKDVQMKFNKSLKWFSDKYSKSRGRGSERSERGIFNHPRRDSQVRSGKK